jgi:TetR/AcrR family transcriptional regulator, regulator of cefoperazone and chloramphenicol sensitivity
VTSATPLTGDRETRERLLREAERLFADRGFNGVTVREICSAARANVAAVNYYFGDKLELYREVMRTAIEAMREVTESARASGQGVPPADRLRAYVALFLQRVLTPGGETIHRLIQRETADPTPLLDDLVQQGLRPRLEYLAAIVAEMIGCDAADSRVTLCVMSIVSQTVMYARHPAIATRLGYPAYPDAADVEQAARHIAEFSIGGILAVGKLTCLH